MEMQKMDAVSIDIYNLSDEDDDDDENGGNNHSSSVKSPEEDSKASVLHRLGEPGPSRQYGHAMMASAMPASSSAGATAMRPGNKKNHTEIEPGGAASSRTVDDLLSGGLNSNSNTDPKRSTNSTDKSLITEGTSHNSNSYSYNSSIQSTNKLMRQRAPLNNRGRNTSTSTFTTTTNNTLMDSVLMETTPCDRLLFGEPVSPPFASATTINLPNVPTSPPQPLPALQPPPHTFSICSSDNNYANRVRTPVTPPPSTSKAATAAMRAFFGPSSSSSSTGNTARHHFLAAGPSQSTSSGELELVLSPAKLGQP